jgi:N utilization substance protein A
LEEARKLDANLEIGDIIKTGHIKHNPGRIAAQTAKQVVMQRLREAERDLVFGEYIDKAGEVMTGIIQRMEPRFITLDLGRAEAIMPPEEQSPFERYRPGQQLKMYVVRVERTVRGPEIVVSRTHPDLLRRLFEIEVPEIFNGVVEIKSIAREPGSRSKVAVHSNQTGVDAVGACVGLRGIRIQNVVNELLGEKIDVIEWDEDPAKFIANSLSPATVDRVELEEAQQSASVIVPDRQLSLAIGREGQNARLAARLTGWRIDIKGTSEALAETLAATPPAVPAVAEPEAPVTMPEPEAAPVTVAAEVATEVAAAEAEPTVPETGEAAGTEEDAEQARKREEEAALVALEEELANLEREEAARREAERQQAAASVDIASDDLWQVPLTPEEKEEAGVLRFAEDIAGFREGGEGRRGRGRRAGGARGGARGGRRR